MTDDPAQLRSADRYVWLLWCCGLVLLWVVIYWSHPRLRRAMRFMGLVTLPFGLTEALFLGGYWNPPTVFDLGRHIHFDLESFLFCFAIGGLAAVLFNVATRRPIHVDLRPWPNRGFNEFILSVPAVLFPLLLVITRLPLISGIVAAMVGALARIIYRPELRLKTLLGGALFCGLYALGLLLLVALEPDYVARVWNHRLWSGMRVYGLPVMDLLFGLTFGLFWSGLYEQIMGTFRVPMNIAQSPDGTCPFIPERNSRRL